MNIALKINIKRKHNEMVHIAMTAAMKKNSEWDLRYQMVVHLKSYHLPSNDTR